MSCVSLWFFKRVKVESETSRVFILLDFLCMRLNAWTVEWIKDELFQTVQQTESSETMHENSMPFESFTKPFQKLPFRKIEYGTRDREKNYIYVFIDDFNVTVKRDQLCLPLSQHILNQDWRISSFIRLFIQNKPFFFVVIHESSFDFSFFFWIT